MNLESLLSKDEVEKLTKIRIRELPQLIEKIGTGGFGDVNLYTLNDGSMAAGKTPRINIFGMSSQQERELKMVRDYVALKFHLEQNAVKFKYLISLFINNSFTFIFYY